MSVWVCVCVLCSVMFVVEVSVVSYCLLMSLCDSRQCSSVLYSIVRHYSAGVLPYTPCNCKAVVTKVTITIFSHFGTLQINNHILSK